MNSWFFQHIQLCIYIIIIAHMAPQLIVLPSGIERVFPSAEARSLNHWTDREVPHYAMFLIAEYILHIMKSNYDKHDINLISIFVTSYKGQENTLILLLRHYKHLWNIWR